MENILSIEDVAEIIGYKVSTIRNQIYASKDKNKIPPARKAGRNFYFLRSDVEDWIANRPVTNK